MNNDSHKQQHQTSGFFYREDVIRWILRIFYLCCVVLIAMDFLFHRHTETDIEKIPTFYALYGFAACVVIVMLAKCIRFILIRNEDYYGEPESAEDFLQKQGLALPENRYQQAQETHEQSTRVTSQESS